MVARRGERDRKTHRCAVPRFGQLQGVGSSLNVPPLNVEQTTPSLQCAVDAHSSGNVNVLAAEFPTPPSVQGQACKQAIPGGAHVPVSTHSAE